MEQKKADQDNEEQVEVQHLLDQVELDVEPTRTGILLARLEGFDESGQPLVQYAVGEQALVAQTTVPLNQKDVGTQVATSFVTGPVRTPIILGIVQNPPRMAEVRLDGERLLLEGKKEVEIRCGKAAILLKEDGKVIIKGTHLVSRSSGANKLKGASVAIN